MKNIVKKISEKNLKAYKLANPKMMIIGTPEAFASFSNDNNYKNVTSVVDEFLKSVKKNKNLNKIKKTVALHRSCRMDNDPFYHSTKLLLRHIPGLNVIELEGNCGHDNFNKIDGESKQNAIDLMNEAAEKGADIIICTSPYCESHLLMCSREGSWRAVDIEISPLTLSLISIDISV